jgi:hypothetical protein
LPADWYQRLKAETIEPPGISYEEFALGDDDLYEKVVRQAEGETVHFADDSGGKSVKLALWAGLAGIRIEASEVRIVLITGEVQLSEIEGLHGKWWTYWRDYWKKLNTPEALPKDYACEVTIPLKVEE